MAIIDRIKYDAPSDDAIVWKFPSESIRLGAQLIVNESQDAVFFKGGKALDTFGAGTHTLSSDNIPLLSKLINLPFGGKTPFTAEVWYVNKTVKRDLKWGTKGPVQVIDPMYNYPVSVRAFGRWGMRINDARSFVVQMVGTQTSSDLSRKGYIGSERVEEYFVGKYFNAFRMPSRNTSSRRACPFSRPARKSTSFPLSLPGTLALSSSASASKSSISTSSASVSPVTSK